MRGSAGVLNPRSSFRIWLTNRRLSTVMKPSRRQPGFSSLTSLSDQTLKHLVICEQLFGAGKTTFANVLGEGLRAGFGGRMLLK